MIKKIVATLLVASAGLVANIYNLKPIEITKDIHCVIGDFNPPNKKNKGFVSNSCYVDIGDSLVVLDAGPTYNFAKEFYEVMKKQYPNKKISAVVLSNYHDDRTMGASFFKAKGIKIVGYKNINDDIKGDPDHFERIVNVTSKEEYNNTKITYADTLVDNGYKIKGSKKSLEILKLSPVSEEKSDIAIYDKADKFLFAGNIVFNGRMLNYTKHSNIDGWINALEKIEKMDLKYVLGGHGKEYNKDSYKRSLEYLKILKEDVKKAYDKGIDRIDAYKHVRDSSFKGINFYDKLNRMNISRYYDQLEWSE